MHSIVHTLKCRNLNVGTEDLNVGLRVNHLGLNAVTTRELPNYVDCTVHQ